VSMCIVGGHWEIIGCVGSLFKYSFKSSPLERRKYSGASSGVFDISSTVWSVVSPIPDYCVAMSRLVALVIVPIDCHQDSLFQP
jgi:hypothetical protein